MTLTRRARELVIVATLLALASLFLRASVKAPADLSLLDRAILRASAPIQAAVVYLVRGVGHAWHRYVYLVGVEAQRDKLAEDNARLHGELERTRRDHDRVLELERDIDLRLQLPMEARAARVVGVETSSFFRVVRLRIDRGDAEVRAGMAVVAPDGVVGRVQRVFGGYSDVVLAVDPKSSIDVVVPRTGGRGVLKGIAGDNRYRMRIEYLLRKDEVAVGDVVVTSGLGAAFPRNLPVGRVVKVVKRDFGLYQEAEVEPAVDFSRLVDVMVLVPQPPAASSPAPAASSPAPAASSPAPAASSASPATPAASPATPAAEK